MTTASNLGDTFPPPLRRRRRWGRWAALVVLVLLMAAFGSFLVWRGNTAGAFGREIAAFRAAGEPATVQELNDWPLARTEGENAVPLLRKAADAVNDQSDAWKRTWAGTDEILPPLREEEVAALEALVKECGPALEGLDEATERPGVDWGLRITSPMIQYNYPDLNKQRGLANLLRFAAILEHHRGNDAEAVRRVAQGLFVARAIDHHPTLVSHLVAIGCYAVAINGASAIAPELKVAAGQPSAGPGDGARPASAQAVRDLIAQFLDEKPLADGQRRSWAGERVSQIDAIQSLADGTMAGGAPGPGLRTKLFFLRPVFYENGRVMVAYTTRAKEASATSADLPAYRQKVPDKLPAYLDSRRYFLASMLLPSLNRANEQHYRILADRRLAATVLACRLYAVDHEGRLPKTLKDLVPDYLPAVPLDPLAPAGTPLGYVNAEDDPERPRVYSVGANGIDQGGADPDERKLSRREYEAQRDEVRYLKRQPRREPLPEPEEYPMYPGMYPGMFPPVEGEDGDEPATDASPEEPAMRETEGEETGGEESTDAEQPAGAAR